MAKNPFPDKLTGEQEDALDRAAFLIITARKQAAELLRGVDLPDDGFGGDRMPGVPLFGVSGGWRAVLEPSHYRCGEHPAPALDVRAQSDTTLSRLLVPRTDVGGGSDTQVLDGAARAAVDQIGSELFNIAHTPGGSSALTH